MGAKTLLNFRSTVHAASGGVGTAFPDVCQTPTPAGPVPIPYPNVAQSSNMNSGQASKAVKIDGNAVMLQDTTITMSTGDEAGSAGGVVSGMIKGKAQFVVWSFDVMIEGKGVPRQLDPMVQNMSGVPNTPPMPIVQS